MRVLLLGGGGREHALGWKLARSPRVEELYSLPGNPGLSELGPLIEGISPTDAGAVSALARIHDFDLVVVGPESPLAAGVSDAIGRLGIPVFGPTRAAARLESSKTFAKEVMARAGVATAAAETFTDPVEAKRHLERSDPPYVVKADGLAGGKGVLVTGSRTEATSWVDQWVGSGPIVIEEHLDGPEVSVFAVCTSKGVVTLEPARDYKRLHEGDLGPNTGGMGAYSPVTLPEGLIEDAAATVIEPVLAQMTEDGSPFTGFLYAGLVLTDEGLRVLEFNVRLGDPETQVLMPRLKTDLVDVLEGATPEWSSQTAVDVALTSAGYPDTPRVGDVITGLGDMSPDVLIFHAGTRRDGKRLVTDGGRVLNVVGIGDDLSTARDRAYAAAEGITWPGRHMRTDVGVNP